MHKHQSKKCSPDKKCPFVVDDLEVRGRLKVKELAKFYDSVKVKDDLSICKNLSVRAEANFGKTVNVAGNLNVRGAINASEVNTSEVCFSNLITAPEPHPGKDCIFVLNGELVFQQPNGTIIPISLKPLVFTWTIILQLQQWIPADPETFTGNTRNLIGEPFAVDLDIRVDDTQVTIKVPALSFNLAIPDPNDGHSTPVPGFVITVANNLPTPLWPATLIPVQGFMGGQQTSPNGYQWAIGADGSLLIGGANSNSGDVVFNNGQNPINPGGGQLTTPTVIVYTIPAKVLPPPPQRTFGTGPNTIVGTEVDAPLGPFGGGLDLGDYVANQMLTDKNGKTRAVVIWTDTTLSTTTPPNFSTLFAQTGIVNDNGIVNWAKPVNVINNGLHQWVDNLQVAIDPTNVDHFVIGYIFRNFPNSGPPTSNRLLAVTTDGGATYTVNINPAPGDPSFGEPWYVIDGFGNVWATAEFNKSGSPNPEAQKDFGIYLSNDGGLTFNRVAIMPSKDQANGFLDFNKSDWGPDPNNSGGLALWFAGGDADFTTNTVVMTVGYLPIMGKGSFGSIVFFNQFNTIPISGFGIANSTIVVNKITGAVYFQVTNVNDFAGTSNTPPDGLIQSIFVNPQGTRNFGPASFLPRRTFFFGNANISSGGLITTRLLPWVPVRGTVDTGVPGIFHDPSTGRLYAMGWDMRPLLGPDGKESFMNVVWLSWSTNEGISWSDQFILNANQTTSAAFVSGSADGVKGLVMGTWYQPPTADQTFYQMNAAIFPAPDLSIFTSSQFQSSLNLIKNFLPQKKVSLATIKSFQKVKETVKNNSQKLSKEERGKLMRVTRL
jgi:hypothetical protein